MKVNVMLNDCSKTKFFDVNSRDDRFYILSELSRCHWINRDDMFKLCSALENNCRDTLYLRLCSVVFSD